MMKTSNFLTGLAALALLAPAACKLKTGVSASVTANEKEDLEKPFPDVGSIMLKDNSRIGANSIVAFRDGIEGIGRVKSFGQKAADYYRYHVEIQKTDGKLVSVPIEDVETFSDGTGEYRKGVFVTTRSKGTPLYMVWGTTATVALVSEVVFNVPKGLIDDYFFVKWDITAPVGKSTTGRFDALENFKLTTLSEFTAVKTQDACRIVQLDYVQVNDFEHYFDENNEGKEVIKIFPKKGGSKAVTRSVCLQVFKGPQAKDELFVPPPAEQPVEIFPRSQNNLFRSKSPYSFILLKDLKAASPERIVIQKSADEHDTKILRSMD